jgi:modulator of FtsH protease HflC
MTKTRKNRLIGSLVAFVLVGTFLSSTILYTVSERELAVVLQFGNPVTKRVEPGIYFKMPFIQEVRRLPKTLQYWQTSEPVVDLLTADGEKIEVTAWAIWRITDPQTFVQVLRTVDNAEIAQVKVKVRAAIRDVITSHTLTDVIRNSDRELTYTFVSVLPDKKQPDADPALPNPALPKPDAKQKPIGRTKILAMIRQRVEQSLRESANGDSTDRGIELVDLGISSISFVPMVRQAAFEKQKAFMESIAARHLNEGQRLKQEILNATLREVEKILGDGEEKSTVTRGEVDAENIKRYATAIEATGDFYKFLRTLEVYEKSLHENTRLIMTTNSELFRLLKEVEQSIVDQSATE